MSQVPPAPPRPKTGPAAPQVRTPVAAPTAALSIGPRARRKVAPRIVYYAVAGFGKTTAAAQAPKPLILMAPRETGYDTLLARGTVPQVAADVVPDYPTLLAWLDALAADTQGIETLVIDSFGGMAELCERYVIDMYFKGDPGEKGYQSFGKGPDRSAMEWMPFLRRLDAVNARGVTIVLLGHARVTKFKNPDGSDYDRYIPDLHPKLWAPTFQWADEVLFGRFWVDVIGADSVEEKGKAVGGSQRVVHAKWSGTYDAKAKIAKDFTLSDDPNQNWSSIWSAVMGEPTA